MEQDDFVQQASEPIQQEVTKEPEYVVEEEQTAESETLQEPVVDPNTDLENKFKDLEDKMTQMSNENESLKYQHQQSLMAQPQQQAQQQITSATSNAEPKLPDQYSENYNSELAAYLAHQNKKVAEDVSKEYKTRIEGIEILQGQQAYQAGIEECKRVFGNNFDINKEGPALQNLMQTRNIPMLEAKKLLEFDALQERARQLESGETERMNVQVPTGGGSNSNEGDKNVIKVRLTDREKAYCQAKGKDINEFAKWKNVYETSEGHLPI